MAISRVLTVFAAATLVSACGAADGGSGEQSRAVAGGEVVPSAEPRVQAVDPPPQRVPATRAVGAPAPAQEPTNAISARLQELEQPAIWPAADVVFATPEEAATDFVREVLISDGEPELGEFQQGDARSGEITVFFPGETEGSERFERGFLALRQLGPDNGWFVIAAASDGANIVSPEALAEVTAGPLTVEGEARGFESTVVVSAFPAGDIDTLLDQEIASGGAFGDVEPYSAVLDLSNAAPGEVVTLLVQGDTGLGNDPSTFAAIPIVVENVVPPTR